MRKKIMMIAVMMMVGTTACGLNGGNENQAGGQVTVETAQQEGSETKDAEETTQEDGTTAVEKKQIEYDNSSLDGILKSITEDFEVTIDYLKAEQEATFEAVGETYGDYVDNKELVSAWYALAIAESEALLNRSEERSAEYFNLIVTSVDHDDSDEIEDALDEYYDTMDDTMEELYDALDEGWSEMYEHYYDGIVNEGYDLVAYKLWSEESSNCYKVWSDTSSQSYIIWSDASTLYYRIWSAMNSAFDEENYDVDSILAEVKAELEAEKAEEEAETENGDTENTETSEALAEESKQEEKVDESAEMIQESSEEVSQEENNLVDGMRPEFKEAMDGYEVIFQEYCEFMEKYKTSDNPLLLMADYYQYMSQYTEAMEALDAIGEEEMNDVELQYYLEVMNRINQMLLDAAM